jgi:hypothetical protein
VWTVTDSNGIPIASYPLGFGMFSRTIVTDTAVTTYTPPTGARALFVECIGGGAGGGGVADAATNGAGAGGGGGGAYSNKLITGALKSSYTIAVGAKGTGGAAGANNGNPGSDTTFDSPSVCTADGGLGGAGFTTTAGPVVGGVGGQGGLASNGVGDLKFDGAPGETGLALAAAQNCGGAGGKGPYGGGGIAQKTAAAGVNAANYGAGGGGACNLSSVNSFAGGDGSAGVIIIWEFV